MATYSPPTINDGDSFDSATVNTGCSDLGTAVNAAVDVNNIAANTLDATCFHKNSLTEVWSVDNRGLTASLPIRFAGAADADTLIIQSGSYFDLLNRFDVEDLSLRFYMKNQGDLSISATVDLLYAKTAIYTSSNTFTHVVSAQLYLDGTAILTLPLQQIEVGEDSTRLPLPVHLDHVASSVSAGWHDLWVHLDFRSSTVSPVIGGGAAPAAQQGGFIQWKCGGRSLNVVALYR